MSYAKKGENNPFFGKNHSDETRKKMSDAILGRAKPVWSGRPCKRIEVFDNKNNSTTIYDSIRAAARALNMDCGTISSYLKRNQQKPYKGQYIFKQV